MRRAFAVLGALAGAGACGDTTTSSGPNVLVFRETSRGCMVLLSGSDDGAVFTRPEGAPGTAVTCGSGSADGATQGSGGPFVVCGSDPAISEVGGVRPGIDVLDVVIDYGSDLSASGVLTAPVLTLYFDGVGSAAPAPTLQPRLDNHTYYTGSIVVPAVESNDITLGVSVVNGFSTTVPTTFKAYVPPIVFSLYRITNGGMQLVGLAALPAIVPSTTAGSTIGSGALLAGTDTALLALDYGSLDIPTSKVLAPMLSLLVNDAPLSVTATSSPQ
ncbi:MAG TPA: hypothetical protein VH165_09760, partial [Kofleriaceae bacterium]|nr:hypothetical protein [Kofleriaceae bacterium]